MSLSRPSAALCALTRPSRSTMSTRATAVYSQTINRQLRRSNQQQRHASTLPKARLNVRVNLDTHPLLHHSSSSALAHPELSTTLRRTSKTSSLTLHEAINAALRHALSADDSVVVFGEDVHFGGVFRCSANLAADFGEQRVFNTPLCEQGIAGFAVGMAAEGMKPVAEIQFADYAYPAFDQIVNEGAKLRYREGKTGYNCGGLVVRMPCGAIGHGAMYHTQSPEALYTHIPGLRVVIPRSPFQAKGLLLAAIESPDPVVFLEPKILYRQAKEQVPLSAYTLPLSTAEILKPGTSATVISYGYPLYLCRAAIDALERDLGGDVSIELIDLRTVYPWDRKTIIDSVNRTGRAVVVHESMINAGVGAEVAATVQERCFLRLEAPVNRVAGWSTHQGLMYEQFNLPDVARIYDAIKSTVEF